MKKKSLVGWIRGELLTDNFIKEFHKKSAHNCCSRFELNSKGGKKSLLFKEYNTKVLVTIEELTTAKGGKIDGQNNLCLQS
jgi:hypothetical protein